MGGRFWKQDDEYPRGIVREIRHGGDMVRGGEDVDRKRADAKQARVVAGGVSEWHSLAGRENRVADDGGDGGGRKRRRADEQDDDEHRDAGGGDEQRGFADNDRYKSAVYILNVYV